MMALFGYTDIISIYDIQYSETENTTTPVFIKSYKSSIQDSNRKRYDNKNQVSTAIDIECVIPRRFIIRYFEDKLIKYGTKYYSIHQTNDIKTQKKTVLECVESEETYE